MTIRSVLENHRMELSANTNRESQEVELLMRKPSKDKDKRKIRKLRFEISNKEKEVRAMDKLLKYHFPDQLLEKEVSWLRDKTGKKNNTAIFGSNMRTAIRSELSFDEWEHAVRTINSCFSSTDVVSEWFEYKPGSTATDKILKTEKIFERNEIYIKMLKFLQGGEDPEDEKTRVEIGEYFSIKRDAVDDYLKELQYGIGENSKGLNILGQKVKIEEFYRGKNLYDNTVHPVFLTLNLSEIAFMTIGLKKIAKEHYFYSKKANDIADDIYHQLSDYARERIEMHPDFEKDSFLESPPVSYREENHDLLYYQKLGVYCWIESSAWEGAKYGRLKFYDERNDTIEFYENNGDGKPVILNCNDEKIKIALDK